MEVRCLDGLQSSVLLSAGLPGLRLLLLDQLMGRQHPMTGRKKTNFVIFHRLFGVWGPCNSFPIIFFYFPLKEQDTYVTSIWVRRTHTQRSVYILSWVASVYPYTYCCKFYIFGSGTLYQYTCMLTSGFKVTTLPALPTIETNWANVIFFNFFLFVSYSSPYSLWTTFYTPCFPFSPYWGHSYESVHPFAWVGVILH